MFLRKESFATVDHKKGGRAVALSCVWKQEMESKEKGGVMLTKEQLEERRNYLGASEAAGVLGLSHWDGQTPLAIWAHKVGEIEREDISGKLYVKLGHLLEDDMTQLFEEETGKKLHRVNETQYHKQYKFIAANIDRRVIGENVPVELKTASAYKTKEWADNETPKEYLIQCQHILAVTEKPYMYLAVLIGNQDFQIRKIDRDEPIINTMIAREVVFWREYVETKIMPHKVMAKDDQTLEVLYPGSNQQAIDLTDDAAQLIEMLDGYDQDSKNLEVLIATTKNKLKQLLGENEMGVTPTGAWCKWSNVTTRRLDSKGLLEKYPDIHAEFYKGTVSRRFTYDIPKERK